MHQTYAVSWDHYQGPLDQLLLLVKEEKVLAEDLPLTTLIDQFLHYLETIPDYPLTDASEAVWLFGALIELKSLRLLPPVDSEEEDVELTAIEASLVDHISLYRTYQGVARSLLARKDAFQKAYPRLPRALPETPRPVRFKEVGAEVLVEAFREVMTQFSARERTFSLEMPVVTVGERLRELERYFRIERQTVVFASLFMGRTRLDMIVTFLALLELLRRRRVALVTEEGNECLMIMPRGGIA